jgi:hypothetical protein
MIRDAYTKRNFLPNKIVSVKKHNNIPEIVTVAIL